MPRTKTTWELKSSLDYRPHSKIKGSQGSHLETGTETESMQE